MNRRAEFGGSKDEDWLRGIHTTALRRLCKAGHAPGAKLNDVDGFHELASLSVQKACPREAARGRSRKSLSRSHVLAGLLIGGLS